ncbi:MAG: bifunctional metallophosphatase/5'-nucleotidase [Candidatus Rifleibacteriota bacterium]
MTKQSQSVFNLIFKFFVLFLLLTISAGLSAQDLNFTIIHTSDEHSSLVPVPYSEYLSGPRNKALGGFARLATLIERIRNERKDEPVVLLSSGDFLGGTPFSWLSLASQTPELDLLQALGYNATTLGNHEFDFGSEALADYLICGLKPDSPLQIISTNLQIPAGHPLEKANIKPYHLMTLENGLIIGIMALIGKDAIRLSPAAKPLTFSDQHQSAQKAVGELRKAGAEVIIALSHSGYYEDIELARAVPDIDLILGGHNHIETPEPVIQGKTIIMHSGAYLQNASELNLAFNRNEKKLKLHSSNSVHLHKIDESLPENAAAAEKVNEAIAGLNTMIASFTDGEISDINRTVACSDFSLLRHKSGSETNIGNFITDAMRIEVEKLKGCRVDVALHANGIIRGNIIPAESEVAKGHVSLYDLITISSLGCGLDRQPGYALVSFYLTEAELLNLLEISTLLPILWNDIYFLQFSGLSYFYDPNRAYWFWIPVLNKPLPAYKAILNASIYTGSGVQTGENFKHLINDNSKLYHVVTTHYLATYLPMVGKKLPRLNLTLKNVDGRPVELDQTIIRNGNREFKLWEATARYAASFATETGSIGKIPEYYRQTGERIVLGNGTSLWFWPVLIIIVLSALVFISKRFFKQLLKKQEPQSPAP